MIKITDIGGHEIYINIDLIEKIFVSPDTVIFFLNGTQMLVKESPEEIVERIAEFRRRCNDKTSIEICSAAKEEEN